MIEISYKNATNIAIKNSDNKNIFFDFDARKVYLDDFDVSHP